MLRALRIFWEHRPCWWEVLAYLLAGALLALMATTAGVLVAVTLGR